MKKLLKLIILVFALNILSVKAADFQTKITGDTKITSGGTITVTFKANSSVGLQGIQAKLNYDSSLLEIVSSKGASDFNLTLGSKAVLDSSTAKSGNFNFMVIKFKAKSAFNIGASTTISLSNVTGSDGTKTLTGTASSLTVKMASSENNLSDLTIDSKTINNFKSSTTSYKLIVENNVSKITIGAKAVDSKAKITGTGTKNLAIYNNTFKVVVTAESGATKT